MCKSLCTDKVRRDFFVQTLRKYHFPAPDILYKGN
jgi:hypothetical protein